MTRCFEGAERPRVEGLGVNVRSLFEYPPTTEASSVSSRLRDCRPNLAEKQRRPLISRKPLAGEPQLRSRPLSSARTTTRPPPPPSNSVVRDHHVWAAETNMLLSGYTAECRDADKNLYTYSNISEVGLPQGGGSSMTYMIRATVCASPGRTRSPVSTRSLDC